MDKKLSDLLDHMGESHREDIEPDARHYKEVSVGRWAAELGYTELAERFKDAYAVIPLKTPAAGMKVRIDGRTFVGYRRHDSGMAIPGYVARAAGKRFRTFIPNDSMILNCC